MKQTLLVISFVGFVLIVVGCEKAPEPRPRADLALDGLMPIGDPGIDMTYLTDQSKVKTLPLRPVPEGSLRTIAPSPTDTRETAAPTRDAPSMPTPMPTPAPAAGGGSFWGRLGNKALAAAMQGGNTAEPAVTTEDDDEGDTDDENEEEEDTEEEAEE